MSGSEVPRTTDVVFIVEAKSCNNDLAANKNITLMISALEKGFNEIGLQNVRYALQTWKLLCFFSEKGLKIVFTKLKTDMQS